MKNTKLEMKDTPDLEKSVASDLRREPTEDEVMSVLSSYKDKKKKKDDKEKE